MDRALDYAAKSTDPSAQLCRAGRRKRYDGIPVRRIESVSVYDHAFDDFTLRTGVARSYTSCPYREPEADLRRLIPVLDYDYER